MSNGLFLPDATGNMRFRETASEETRPVLQYESDTGRLILNFNTILMDHKRVLEDIQIITRDGTVMGLMLTSRPMGPEEIRRLEEAKKKT